MNALPPLPALDLALRAGLIALLLFVAALVARDRGGSIAARLAIACASGLAARLLYELPGFATPSAWWQAPLLALAVSNAAVFWLFARALFDDEFALRWRHHAVWLCMVLLGLANCYVLRSWWPGAAHRINGLLTLAALAFALLSVAQALATWRADLVEGRRRLRGFVVGAGAAYTLVSIGVRLAGGPGAPTPLSSLLDTVALAAVVVPVVWLVASASRPSLFAQAPHRQKALSAVAEGPAPARPPLESADPALKKSLEEAMTVHRVYRKDGLTISALADRLGVQEYKLRRLINQGLGYRNFNAFLNHHRLQEVLAALVDPAQADRPVLTLALEAGFQSLGPFNRAFKAHTGMTPTEYRRSAGAVRSGAAGPLLADSEIG